MSDSAKDDRGLFGGSVGAQLAAERERQQLDLSEVAARTRVPLRHLEAIEQGQYDGLPALPYSAGFVKSYANMLGLDGQALSKTFREQVGDERRYFEPEAYEPVDPSRVPSRLLVMIALGVALLLGMVYLLIRFKDDNSELARLAADTVQDVRPMPAKPVAPPPAPVPAQPATPTGPITVNAVEDVWIKVSESAGGDPYFMNVLKAGDSFTVPDSATDPILRTGRPQVVKVKLGDSELPPVGQPDHIVRAYSLKRDALLGILAAPATPAAAAPTAADNAAVPVDAPVERPRRRVPRPAPEAAPPGDDPAGSRPASTGPAPDSDQRPQP